jgi:hypothetical protein
VGFVGCGRLANVELILAEQGALIAQLMADMEVMKAQQVSDTSS